MIVKQIILITDGCSNIGVNPVTAAAHALAEDIVVNVIGVIDQGDIGDRGRSEINEIAQAGGGMSRIVTSAKLAQTVQMMTRQTVVQTIHNVVRQQLQALTGESELETLSPEKRGQVVQLMDDLSETSALQIALLIDTSASMKPKLAAVETAIQDLMLSLQARQGESELAVFHYPGSRAGHEVEMKMNWTSDLVQMQHLFSRLNMGGTTPTGPALMKVIRFFVEGRLPDVI